MPIVQIEMLKGRTLEQKREMVKEVTEAISKTANCPKENVRIIIREMDPENFAEVGVLRCDKK
ncbi:MAG TPA: 2-hydroxymuconate tautomerase family protein [Tissierellia bacterium]|jgi:4-oxalocrotonate tautomerase|nr:2-hydroxymuconate tautomerase family protein [Tissierellia bacterium]